MKLLVLFYSTYGHVYRLAQAVAEGAGEIPNVDVMVRRVPETLSPDIVQLMGATDAQKAFADVPVAIVDDLMEPGAIIFGTPTRFGNMAGQMRQFLDATGGLWAQGKLVGKAFQGQTRIDEITGGRRTERPRLPGARVNACPGFGCTGRPAVNMR